MNNAFTAFPLGKVMITRGIAALAERGELNPRDVVNRHALGDDGDVCPEDRDANLFARKNGLRVVSVYRLACGKTYVITEADRSSTTVLLAEEY